MKSINLLFGMFAVLSFNACAGSEPVDFVGCEWMLSSEFQKTTDSQLLKSYARVHSDGKAQVAAFYFDKDYPIKSFEGAPAKDVKSAQSDRYQIYSYFLEDEFSGKTSRIVDFIAGSNYVQLTNFSYEDALSISNECVSGKVLKEVY